MDYWMKRSLDSLNGADMNERAREAVEYFNLDPSDEEFLCKAINIACSFLCDYRTAWDYEEESRYSRELIWYAYAVKHNYRQYDVEHLDKVFPHLAMNF